MTLKQDEQRPFLLGKERESMVLTTGTKDAMTSPRKECKYYHLTVIPKKGENTWMKRFQRT
jgi:hypothetical protein